MSTLKTHNLQSADSGSVNIALAPNAGMVVTGISTFSNDIVIPDKIIHSGDTNTAIRFPAADTFSVETAGSERLRIDSSGAVILKNTAAATPRSDFLGSLKPISQIASTWNAYHSLTRHDAGSSYGPYLILAKNKNDAYNSNGKIKSLEEKHVNNRSKLK